MNTKEAKSIALEMVEKYIKSKKYTVVEKNFVFKIPDTSLSTIIDIIAKKKDAIYFVIIKILNQQGLSRLFSSNDKLGFWERKKTIKAIEYWLSKNKTFSKSKWEVVTAHTTIDLANKKAKIIRFEAAQ